MKGLKNKKIKTALMLFIVQLLLNFLWSFFFFYFRNPLLGFIDIILLWLTILTTMSKFYEISKPSAYLLVPYILWVSFAALLNFAILLLNR